MFSGCLVVHVCPQNWQDGGVAGNHRQRYPADADAGGGKQRGKVNQRGEHGDDGNALVFAVVEQVVHQQVIGQGEPEAEQEQDGVILAARILRAQQPCEQRVGQQPCDGGGEGAEG